MTIDELHIGIDVGISGTNTFTNRSLDPEEKDWWINKCQYLYIWDKTDVVINPKQQKFASTKKRIGDIQNLIVPTSIKLYKDSEGVFFGMLPSDFLLYIDDNTSLVRCGVKPNYPLTKDKVNYFVIPFRNMQLQNIEINALDINNNSKNIINSDNEEDFVQHFSEEKELSFYFKYWITQQHKLKGDIDIYWETYNGLYYPESFIIVANQTVDKIVYTINDTIKIIDKTVFEFDYYSISQNDKKYISGTLLSPEDFTKLTSNYFYTPRKDKIFYTLKNNRIYVYCDKNLKVNEIKFDYYREPRYVNYKLGITSEITPTRHHELINLVVKEISGLNPNQNYQTIIPNIIQNQN